MPGIVAHQGAPAPDGRVGTASTSYPGARATHNAVPSGSLAVLKGFRITMLHDPCIAATGW
jgi:hypothetical protein